ncbi:putative selenium-dependent hydroxylase accessory protein YqeC [Chloroflexi bacterium CFX2]|nr:putative selenium-dependent hydroxylase accessory protein YqeC [Chloroflexi bacterium CFX2]
MNLAHALRLDSSNPNKTVSLAGAGGKTTALFQLARQFDTPVLVTATTHLGVWQVPLADRHIIAHDPREIQLPAEGITLVTGEIENERTKPVSEAVLNWLHEKAAKQAIPLLIEADGSRQKPLKAPAEHEPPIPPFSDIVILIAGLGAIGKPLADEHVQRAELFSRLSGLAHGDPITPQAILDVLTHPQGGLKNIPPHARRIALLNQADTPELQAIGGGMARGLLKHFESVIVGSLERETFNTLERTAGILLAAGKSTRFGAPKQLLDWKGKPFVRHVAETALHSGLEPVVAVTGFYHADVESCLRDLPVSIVHNPEYEQGQSTSVRAGIRSLTPNVGAAIFLLADQPQIPVEVIRALVETHSNSLSPILAPLVLEERRANPVLFDKVAFPDLLQLTGDTGGRAVFDKHRVEYLPWHDDILLFDVDKPEDYERLKRVESSE